MRKPRFSESLFRLLADRNPARRLESQKQAREFFQPLESRVMLSVVSFDAPQGYDVGGVARPYSIVTADLNGDGHLDQVTGHGQTQGFSVFLNNGDGSFGSEIFYGTGGSGQVLGLTVGDFTGDGLLDVAAGGTLNLILYKGTGNSATPLQFVANKSWAGGSSAAPRGVVAADFNNDGKLDVAGTHSGNNTVSLLLGNGNGTFQNFVAVPLTGAANSTPWGMAGGDFNSDGKQDLAVASRLNGHVQVLLGNGAGGFASGGTFAVGANPEGLRAADLDDNGTLDLAVANASTGAAGSVSVLWGNGSNTDADPDLEGDGTFSAGPTVNTYVASPLSGWAPTALSIGDANNDDRLDILVASFNSGDVTVLQNNGAGGFVRVSSAGGAGYQPRGIATGDFNGDGNLDFSMSNYGSDDMTVGFGSGDGTFHVGTHYPVLGVNPYTTTAGDINGDGNADVIVANLSSGNIQIMLGDGAGGLSNGTPPTYTMAAPRAVTLADLNLDGKLDVLTGGSAFINYRLGNGDGTFGAVTSLTAGNSPHAVQVGDLNNDGVPDIATVNYYGNTTNPPIYPSTISVFLGIPNGLGQPTGTFQPRIDTLTGASAGADLGLADFDGDGTLDAATANFTYTGNIPDKISVLRGNGDGTFGAPLLLLSGGANAQEIAIGDFNNDGRPDFAVTNGGVPPALAVFLNSSTGPGSLSFNNGTNLPVNYTGSGSSTFGISAADFNNDGWTDLATTNPGSGDNVDIFVNLGNGVFREGHGFAAGYDPRGLATADLDNDGLPDVITTNTGAAGAHDLSVLINQAPDVDAGGPYSVDEGSGTSLDASGSADFQGDATGLTFAWDLDNDGAFDDATGATPTFSANDGPATQTVRVRVTDQSGVWAVGTTTVTIANVDPSVDAGGNETIGPASNGVFSRSGSFTDPGAADAWTATVDYGDGSGVQALPLNPDKTFNLSHTYAASDLYTVTVEVTDGDGGIGSDSFVVTANLNTAPAAHAGGPYTLAEGGSVSLDGSGSSDAENNIVSYEWDFDYDGVSFDADAAGVSPSFSAANLDGPTSRTVALRVTDSYNEQSIDTASVSVTNADPDAAITGAPATSPEGVALSLGSEVIDPGLADTHGYAWEVTKNGNAFASGTGSGLSFTPDDDGTYRVKLTVVDDDGGQDVEELDIEVTNQAPAVAITGAPASGPEGTAIALGSTLGDAGAADTHTLAWSVTKDGNAYASGSGPSFSFTPDDNGSYAVTLTATDDDNGVASDSKTIAVTNVNPVAGDDAATVAQDDEVIIGVLDDDEDAGAADVLSVQAVGAPQHGSAVLNGDGTITYTPGVGSDATSDSFTYTLQDDDGGTDTATVYITIAQATGVSLDGEGVLRIGGTGGDDQILVTASGSDILVNFNGVVSSFPAASVTDVRAWGYGGNDRIELQIGLRSYLSGGDGNDAIIGGWGDDIVDGGAGDDDLAGSAGNDLIVGGAGRDRLVGSAGHDVLIAGGVASAFDLLDLRAVLAGWAADRSQDLDTSGDDAEVLDEGYDTLTGSSGADWFIISSGDKVTDFKLNNRDGDVVSYV